MINPRELQLGNLVTDEFYDSFKTIIAIDSINDKGVNLNIEDDGNWPELAQTSIVPEFAFDKLRGIPLTEEWLVRFGFDVEYTNGGFLRWQKGNFKLLDRRLPNPLPNSLPVLFVHQLQNLHFIITGHELTYNPK